MEKLRGVNDRGLDLEELGARWRGICSLAPSAVTLNMTCVRRMPCHGGTPVYMPHSSTPANPKHTTLSDLPQHWQCKILAKSLLPCRA